MRNSALFGSTQTKINKKLRSDRGVSLAEVLLVVAIVLVLAGIALIAVFAYQRSMAQLERDGIAKEIFVAAQNHLTAAHGQGYLSKAEGFGTPESRDENADKICYFVVTSGVVSGGGEKAFELMLPFGSIDETVRAGGSYLIRYQPDAGLVLDVFYCSVGNSRFDYSLSVDDYAKVMPLVGAEKKNDRRTFSEGNNSVLGWYGGADAAALAKTTLNPPAVKVFNSEKLYVEVSNPNSGNQDAQLKLIITGVDSKAQKAYELKAVPDDPRIKLLWGDYTGGYTIVLDDVANWDGGMHFGNIDADTTEKFIPGEDIEIQAVAYSTTALTNIAYSSKYSTNSLFGSINTAKDTAYIGNIRHLENLDVDISSLNMINGASANKINIAHAEQTDSFSWTGFKKAIKKIESRNTTGPESDSGYESVCVYDFGGTDSGEGYYMPIEPDYSLTYDGKNRSISDVAVKMDETGDGGLFGATSHVTEIKNLELIDFSITGKTSAGALAGTLVDCTVTNVLARNSTVSSTAKITATTDAGGLIGKLTRGAVQYSAAAVIVGESTTKPTNAGGLIGSASGTITGCYSGGHTQTGSYEEWVKTHPYDVTGGTVGGLVGTSSAAISGSYSTCSVSGATAGGLAGSASGSITNCYATGYIDPNATAKYAFVAGSLPSGSTNNWYYRTINEVPSTKPNAKPDETEPMLPYQGAGEVSNHISYTKPLDLNEESYNEFAGAWDDWETALPYDSSLVKYYDGKYVLRTVEELGATLSGYSSWNDLFVKTHYGDWPSPEVFFINQNS